MSAWEIVEHQEGRGKDARVSYEVDKDRRTVSTGLNERSAYDLVRRLRKPNEIVTLVETDGYRTPVTRQFEKRGWRKPVRA